MYLAIAYLSSLPCATFQKNVSFLSPGYYSVQEGDNVMLHLTANAKSGWSHLSWNVWEHIPPCSSETKPCKHIQFCVSIIHRCSGTNCNGHTLIDDDLVIRKVLGLDMKKGELSSTGKGRRREIDPLYDTLTLFNVKIKDSGIYYEGNAMNILYTEMDNTETVSSSAFRKYILCLASVEKKMPSEGWCEDDVEIGSSDGYKIASDMLMNSTNFSIDPCDDFFEFTCGNWIAKNPIKKHMSRSSQFDLLNDQVNEQVRGIFASNETFHSKSITALKAIYKKCMDMGKLNRRGAKRLIAKVKSHFAWPIIDGDKKWRQKDYDLTSLLIHVSRIRGVNVFVSWDIYHDDKNVSRRIIQFDQADLRLGGSREYYLDMKKYGKKIEALKRYLIRQVKLFQRDGGRPTYRKKIEKDVNEMIDLEIKLAKILVPEENRRNWTRMYNLYHLSDMQKLMPLVNWTRYFLAVAPSYSHNYLKSNPEIIIREVDYMRNITKLLRRVKPRIITNYVLMRLSEDWEGEMGEDYENIAEEFNRIMYGKKEKPPREIYCIRDTVDMLQYATSAVYVRKIFDQESKAVVLEMINDIQKAFREMLSTNKWINSTRNAALEKADSMLSQIAYPNFILNDEELDKYYDGLDVREGDSYSKMLDKVSRWHIEHSFKQLMEPVDRHEYDFNSAEVNAYYMPTSNSIKFPAAILQAPFFHHTFPRALNYGAIGSIIAHEISHAFDDEGSQYDAIGNLREWWDVDVKKKYQKRAQCLIDQYGKIEVPRTGHKINGERTVGENIADNGGVKAAYRAYKAYLRKHGEEKKIKGLEGFSSEQIFFMGYATAFCGDYTKDGLIDYLLRTPHSPMRYRVNQVLANQRGFAAAFSCEKGSKMNPEKRCGVW